MLSVDGVDVLDVREAAEYVQRTPETVRRWVWSGRLSAVRQGNRLLIPRAELDAAVSEAGSAPLSLQEWAQSSSRRGTDKTVTAAALIFEDRADDHGR